MAAASSLFAKGLFRASFKKNLSVSSAIINDDEKKKKIRPVVGLSTAPFVNDVAKPMKPIVSTRSNMVPSMASVPKPQPFSLQQDEVFDMEDEPMSQETVAQKPLNQPPIMSDQDEFERAAYSIANNLVEFGEQFVVDDPENLGVPLSAPQPSALQPQLSFNPSSSTYYEPQLPMFTMTAMAATANDNFSPSFDMDDEISPLTSSNSFTLPPPLSLNRSFSTNNSDQSFFSTSPDSMFKYGL